MCCLLFLICFFQDTIELPYYICLIKYLVLKWEKIDFSSRFVPLFMIIPYLKRKAYITVRT